MKHVTLLAAMAVTLSANAQRHIGEAIPVAHHGAFGSAERTPTDTIVPVSVGTPGNQLALYTASAGNYMVGTNSFGDKAKVQVFTSTGNVHVEQLIYFFGKKNVGSAPTSPLHARVYALDGPGFNTTGQAVNNAPGTVLGNVDIPISAVDTGTNPLVPMIVEFNPAVNASGNFGGGFDVTGLGTGVQLGMLTTQDGATGTSDDQNWEQFSDNHWFAMSNADSSWGVKCDFFMLAVLGNGVAGIHNPGAVNGMRLSIVGGNPATSAVTVAYDLQQAANARLLVIDTKGAKMVERELGRSLIGQHQTDLNVANWGNGTYYVSIIADGRPITKKLVVQH